MHLYSVNTLLPQTVDRTDHTTPSNIFSYDNKEEKIKDFTLEDIEEEDLIFVPNTTLLFDFTFILISSFKIIFGRNTSPKCNLDI